MLPMPGQSCFDVTLLCMYCSIFLCSTPSLSSNDEPAVKCLSSNKCIFRLVQVLGAESFSWFAPEDSSAQVRHHLKVFAYGRTSIFCTLVMFVSISFRNLLDGSHLSKLQLSESLLILNPPNNDIHRYFVVY